MALTMRSLTLAVVAWALLIPAAVGESRTAIFAGGCFWCMEKPFDELPGVASTTAGYIGGALENPSYRQVVAGKTGHAEAVQVVYDDNQVTYEQLLAVFWRNIDPLDGGGQFCDRGSQYRSAIFYQNAAEQALAEASRDAIAASLGQPVATKLEAASTFYPAEAYHQDYYQRNPLRYRYYRHGCGRDKRLAEVWGAAAH